MYLLAEHINSLTCGELGLFRKTLLIWSLKKVVYAFRLVWHKEK